MLLVFFVVAAVVATVLIHVLFSRSWAWTAIAGVATAAVLSVFIAGGRFAKTS